MLVLIKIPDASQNIENPFSRRSQKWQIVKENSNKAKPVL
jgi:hypothetical protein